MPQLKIQPAGGQASFEPGQSIDVEANWQLDEQADSIELRLIWFTEGKGSEDVCVVADHTIEHPKMADSHLWQLELPSQPYSFNGTLIVLVWSLELLVNDGDATTRFDLTIAPGGKAVELR